ncbi:FecR family protein [Pedobacter nutrimenti]|uniref:FecR family protein n=1 Tax=Pedobacter nutrimenti TaxID=1241337 RepID=UPI0029304A32|nr:FecR domain-containing protein [Pedobacter nutrimenti]
MQRKKANQILEKIHQGTATEEETALFESWYQSFHTELTYDYTTQELEQIKAEMKLQLNLIEGRPSVLRLWPRFAAVASIVLCITAAIFFYVKPHGPNQGQKTVVVQNDIEPGGNKAYLTLSNGKRLSLSDATTGTLAQEAGVQISKTSDGRLVYLVENRSKGQDGEGKLNTIETPKGGQYQVRLPDGSKVWLNAASKLSYPVSFASAGIRRVELTGEAYFEVSKDKKHPFIVKSLGQEVEVLGTHFNITSYTDDTSIKTTLLEGSVRVSLPGPGTKTGDLSQHSQVVLKPGEQSVLDDHLKIVQADVEEVMAWKNQRFTFNSQPLESIMRQISRWYDVDIVYKGGISRREFTGTVSRYANVSQVLKMLELTNLVHFKIEERRIIVMP